MTYIRHDSGICAKNFTNDQYRSFLKCPFASNFGVSKNSLWKDVSSWGVPAVSYFGVTRSRYDEMNTYIDNQLGTGAYFMFWMIVGVENPNGWQYGWINHTTRSGNYMTVLKADVAYIKDLLTHPARTNSQPYDANWYSTGDHYYMSNAKRDECRAFYDSCNFKGGEIGTYYMRATLAGNGWIIDTARHKSEVGDRWGNAYDQIIYYIRTKGGNPFVGGTSGVSEGGSQSVPSDPLLSLPKAIHLSGSHWSVLGVDFTRYGDWVYIHYPFEELWKVNGNALPVPSEGKTTEPSSDKVSAMLKEYDKIKNKNFTYAQIRPVGDLSSPSVTSTDCSGFVSWLWRNILTGMWQGGGTTGSVWTYSMYNYCKNHNYVVWEGSQSTFRTQYMSKVKTGDFVIMGRGTYASGNGAHTAQIVAGSGKTATVRSMEPNKLYSFTIDYATGQWWTGFTKFCVCRVS